MRYYLSILLFLVCLVTAAQKPVNSKKAYKPIRTALKAKKPSDALATIKKLVADTIYNKDPKLYAYGIEAEILICEGFNEKMYLGQKIDTAQFFSANYDMCRFMLQCDTAEQKLLEFLENNPRGKKNATTDAYRKQNRQLLLQYYPNLSAAGRFHYAKGQYRDARKYFALYFDLPHHPIWGKDTSVLASKTYHDNIYLDFRAMYELGKYDEMPLRADFLLADSALHDQVLDMLIMAAYNRGDTVDYYKLVKSGLAEHPDRLDYFAILANNYTENGNYEAAIALSDSLLVRDPMNRYYLQCRCLSLFKLNKLDESCIAAERLVDVDSTASDAYYVLGFYYIQQAEQVKLPRQTRSNLYKSAKQHQAELYEKARGYVEHFRELMPEEQERWAPLLYKIYLNLNMGHEFEEIQQYITQPE